VCVYMCVCVCVCGVKTMEKAFYLLLMCYERFQMCAMQETRFHLSHQGI
jgi:hypothetical protein